MSVSLALTSLEKLQDAERMGGSGAGQKGRKGNAQSCDGDSCWAAHAPAVSQEVQVTLKQEIQSACDYRPYENCDYGARLAAELSMQQVEQAQEHVATLQHQLAMYKKAAQTASS
eukprot:jgi/Mesen1/7471/ME000039S06695